MDVKMNNIVLVPTDFSEVCANAANKAAEAAGFLKFKVVLLHVIDKETKAFLKDENLPVGSIDEKLILIANELKKQFEVDVEFLAREGNIFDTIPEVAKELGANLIYLGTHGKVGMQHLTGSFALKVITSSPCPVIVVQKRPFDKGYKTVVLPITSEAGPWEKTKWAVYLAKQFGSTIHLFMVKDADEAIKYAGERIGGYFDKNGVKYALKVAEKASHFSKQVMDYATANNADLIMIMTNPDKGFTTFLLGSYDEETIFNASQIPVMCINPRKFNYEILGF
ncbi:MAG: universal stress protein [Bacteroidales bacterium]|nr:universal stress protein [Bacteroidales bacterium]MDZ4205577.1 universal stress protein [Bacteroidales bacterium]